MSLKFSEMYAVMGPSFEVKCTHEQGRIQSWTLGGHNPELDFGGHKCLFDVKSFLTLFSAIGNSAVWRTMGPGSAAAPGPLLRIL